MCGRFKHGCPCEPPEIFFDIECTHHWQIETATSPTSSGVCLNCGETKDFSNSVSDRQWLAGKKESPEVVQGRQRYFKNREYTPHPYTIHNAG